MHAQEVDAALLSFPGKTGAVRWLSRNSAPYDEGYRIQCLQALSTALALSCSHTAIREDASMNLTAIRAIKKKFLTAELCLLQSGGITWQTTFSPEPAEATIYVIDVLGTRKDWGKGGPGIT